jgi:signal transduction histidine kinase
MPPPPRSRWPPATASCRCVRDDGSGGADFGHGSGLVGLKDRTEALGGRIWLHSPPGAGTVVQIVLPVDDPTAA